jgi:hypothetical protein
MLILDLLKVRLKKSSQNLKIWKQTLKQRLKRKITSKKYTHLRDAILNLSYSPHLTHRQKTLKQEVHGHLMLDVRKTKKFMRTYILMSYKVPIWPSLDTVMNNSDSSQLIISNI